MKKGWKDWPYWQKGAVIGVIVLTLYNILITLVYEGGYFGPDFWFVEILAGFYAFIFGALIGLLVGEYKKYKKSKSYWKKLVVWKKFGAVFAFAGFIFGLASSLYYSTIPTLIEEGIFSSLLLIFVDSFWFAIGLFVVGTVIGLIYSEFKKKV